MNAIKRLRTVIIGSFCCLTACAPPPQSSQQLPAANKIVPVEKRRAETASVSSWEIQGALAAKNKSKGWSATMNWVQKGAGFYQIHLNGPLGGGAVLIKREGGTITFQDGSKTSTSTNADELLVKQTGIRLPVSSLYYWIRGLPAPGAIQARHLDQYNHLAQLKQSGYTIDFAQYTSVKGIDLPRMVRLMGNGVMIKVIIKSWNV